MSQCERMEALARECASIALEAGGTSPFDTDGNPLLPTEPQGGDYAALEDLHDAHGWGEPKPEDYKAFAKAYREAMRSLEWCPLCGKCHAHGEGQNGYSCEVSR